MEKNTRMTYDRVLDMIFNKIEKKSTTRSEAIFFTIMAEVLVNEITQIYTGKSLGFQRKK